MLNPGAAVDRPPFGMVYTCFGCILGKLKIASPKEVRT